MFNYQVLFFDIFLLLFLGVVIAFCYTVIKPAQTLWAVRKGREIAASGEIRSRRQFETVLRLLATAHHDREADYLWEKLRGIKESSESR